MTLSEKQCQPAKAGDTPLEQAEQLELLFQLSSGWAIEKEPARLSLTVTTADFAQALEKAHLIGKMADEQWHHPTLTVAFKSLKVEIYTHVIQNLKEADFIFAAKVDQLLNLECRTSDTK